MADDTPQLTQDQVELFAKLVDQTRRNYGGLPIQLEEPDANGHRDFSYVEPEAGLHISGTAATFRNTYRITRLEITPPDEEGGLTASVMKHVSLGALTASLNALFNMERAEQALAEAQRKSGTTPTAAASLIRRTVDFLGDVGNAEAAPPKRRGGREPLTDELLRDVAVTYLEETGPGKDKKPLERMAKKYDRPEETIRTWVARARKAGWLGPAVRGRAGAEPGPRLLASLPPGKVTSGMAVAVARMSPEEAAEFMREQPDSEA